MTFYYKIAYEVHKSKVKNSGPDTRAISTGIVCIENGIVTSISLYSF